MILSTDSTANLPQNYYKEHNISMIPLQIYMDGEIYDDLSEKLPPEDFYQKMRDGAEPKTAQINEQTAREYFEELLKKGDDVLHISFSSALSGNTGTIMRVADELNQSNKNKIVVVDSLNASAGEGILVRIAEEMINDGKSIDEIASTLNEMRPRVRSIFTVEQLKYLVRGGRVSKFSGVLGSLLNIKPILRVNDEGKLIGFKKVISRKKSIGELASICQDTIADTKHLYIAHAVCLDEANELANILETSIGKRPEIVDLTQVIGSHTGPGLIALFFIAKD